MKNPKADARTMAGAYSGLGDCLYQEAAVLIKENKDAEAVLQEALLSFLRVVVSYKDQTFYVPKAMFYAGRVFDLSDAEDGKDYAQRMYREVMRQFRGSNWADEAKSFKK